MTLAIRPAAARPISHLPRRASARPITRSEEPTYEAVYEMLSEAADLVSRASRQLRYAQQNQAGLALQPVLDHATTTTHTHRLTVIDSREERLNGASALSAQYDFGDAASAELLGQLLLQQGIQAPGRWRRSIAGGVRVVTIDQISDSEQ